MARRYPAQMTGSGSSSCSDDEDSDESVDLREYYCRAITNLTGRIVPLLQYDNEVVTEAFGKGLIGNDTYRMQDSALQAKELLRVLTEVKIRVKSAHYYTFLGILRSTKFSEDVADLIEKEVARLQRQKRKKTKIKSSQKGNRGARNYGREMPKLDLHDDDGEEGYASGFQSELSTRESGDVLSSTPIAITTASTPQIPTTTGPLPFIGSSEVAEESPEDNGLDTGTPDHKKPVQEVPEENRPISEVEKIHSGVQESLPYRRSISGNSVPVFPSQVDALESIQRLAECEKSKRREVIAEKDKTISRLQRKIEVMEKEKSDEKQRYEEEIEKQKEDLEQCEKEIVQKKKEICSLKEKHQKTIKELHQEYKQKIEELKKEHCQQNERAQQEIKKLEHEKNAAELQRSQAEEEVEELKQHYQKIIDEKNKEYNEHVQKLEQDLEEVKKGAKEKESELKLMHENASLRLELKYRDKLDELHKEINFLKHQTTEAKASAKVYEAEMRRQEAEMRTQKAEMQAKEAEMNAQIEIHKSKSENQLALTMQAQQHAQEKQEIILKTKLFYEAQRSLSSGSSESFSQSMSMMQQLSITTTSSEGSFSIAGDTIAEDTIAEDSAHQASDDNID